MRKYLDIEQLVKRQSRTSTNLDAFVSFLLQEDNRGKTYRELHEAIVRMGFNEKYTHFCHRMNEAYETQPLPRTKSSIPILVRTWSPTRLLDIPDHVGSSSLLVKVY